MASSRMACEAASARFCDGSWKDILLISMRMEAVSDGPVAEGFERTLVMLCSIRASFEPRTMPSWSSRTRRRSVPKRARTLFTSPRVYYAMSWQASTKLMSDAEAR